jgi:hypothetical protein
MIFLADFFGRNVVFSWNLAEWPTDWKEGLEECFCAESVSDWATYWAAPESVFNDGPDHQPRAVSTLSTKEQENS